MTDAPADPKSGHDVRLIERWLPIAEIGIESKRERTPMTPFPAPNRLHVWWARRPLVASRAAILASIILDHETDRDQFKHALGIHGDPLAARVRIAKADRDGERLGKNAYGYARAFLHNPTETELDAILPDRSSITVLDATAGGGAIPLEALRLGDCQDFRVWAGIMGRKESHYVPTQGAGDSG
ncbi:MAG: DUF1156 domain-containing protein [Sandarakinorhabdus sp.]|nr:DUF1156 domain-containing protein [Sandarakinorhabdus sp.]